MHYQWQLMKKWIDEEMKIKFHLNGNIEWHYVQLELNWIKSNQIRFRFNQIELDSDLIELNSNSTKFNSTIGLRFNWIVQIDGEDIKNLLWIWC